MDFFTEVHDLDYLLMHLNQDGRFIQLNKALIELIQDFGLVSFYTLAIDDQESVASIVSHLDHTIGYIDNQNVTPK